VDVGPASLPSPNLQPAQGALAGPFYPETCHPPLMTRRQWLAGSAALVGSGALRPSKAGAGDDGSAIIRQWAGLPDDPWAVCHGVRGMGRDFKLKDGRRAVDWLLETHLVSVPVNGKSFLAFPVDVEAHPNMFLKTMLEAGVPLDHAFTFQRRTRTLGEVVEGAHALFRPSQVIGQPNVLPWSIIALARTKSPVKGRWTNASGEPVDLELVVEHALRLMEEASLPIAQAMRDGRPESTKAPVHSFTCGGAHMLYALLTAAQTGHAAGDRAERVRRQADLMVWRLRADLALIDRFYKERAAQAGAYWYETDAKVKLLGHGEECLAFGVQRGVVKLTEGQQRQRRDAVATLKRMIDEMEGRNLSDARDIDTELFRQLVGDTCHARRGLTLA
jgi:hypothetical protein